MQCFADKTASSISTEREIKKSNSSLSTRTVAEVMPSITNEAEYAEFVRQREGAGQVSSVKASKLLSSASSRSKAAVK